MLQPSKMNNNTNNQSNYFVHSFNLNEVPSVIYYLSEGEKKKFHSDVFFFMRISLPTSTS